MGFFRRKRKNGRGRTTQIDLNAGVLRSGTRYAIAGITFRPEAVAGILNTCPASPPKGLEPEQQERHAEEDSQAVAWFTAILVREPGNEHDPNAVAVFAAETGEQVGYLPSRDAAEFQAVFDQVLTPEGHNAGACPGYVHPNGEGGYWGVLCLSTPTFIINESEAIAFESDDED